MHRKTVLGAVAGLAALAPAATANAAYLKGFSVRDTGSHIRWAVTVCSTAATGVHRFAAKLEPEEQGISYSRHWNGGPTGSGCDRWVMKTQDIWSEQVWDSRLTVIMDDGSILRTPWRSFYID